MFQDFDTKKEKIDLSIAISVILIAGLFIGYYSFQTTNDSNPFGVEINNSEVESLTIESDTYVAENHETSEASAYPKTKNQTKENASEAVIIKSIDSVSIIEKIEVPEVSDQSLQGDKDALLSFKSKPNSGESDSETDSDISLVDEKSVAPIAADVIEKVLPKKEENVEAKIETKIAPKVETKKAIIDNKESLLSG